MNNLILANEHNGVLTIQINRLDKKNALTSAMYNELIEHFHYASGSDHIRCLLIRGDEQCFSAGNDLQDFLALDEQDDLAALNFVKVLAAFDKPLIAAVAGAAVGIGTTLLLHCDMVLAADNSRFQLPFTQLGLCPEAGSSLLLAQRLGSNRAFELLVLGQPFNAERALELGIINEVCSAPELVARAEAIANAIAALPFDAVMTSRRLIRNAQQQALMQTIDEEGQQFLRLVNSDSCKAMLAKFFR